MFRNHNNNHTFLYTILTALLLLGIGTNTVYALDEASAVKIAKNFVENYLIFGINHTVIDGASQIPVSSEAKAKKLLKFSTVVSPPKLISKTEDKRVVQLYTWSKHQGQLLEWKLEIKGNKVRKCRN